ncbi:MFS transporter [Hydrogenovibrio halophilus]|uniref:MFS transporter n=1 Tax=Hydrogenovibrio halophilus TaxID=373391 RepID=UPI000373E17C|nr:MFS transporter [Hydrogenovibrio halophilus]
MIKRPFIPLFWVQFAGAFNDNLYKNALVMLITFSLVESGEEAGLWVAMAAGIFILPFFLFSAFAGQLADRYCKSDLIKRIKLAELLIMLFGAMALIAQSMPLLLGTLFFMGVQSTFFGPIKYAILPEYLSPIRLMQANGWLNASTFVAILLGTLMGGWVVIIDHGEYWMALAVVTLALLGWLTALFLPDTKAQSPEMRLDTHLWRLTWREVAEARAFHQAWFAILSIASFWFVGATFLSQIPVLVKEGLGAEDTVAVALLVSFALGIGLGALWVVWRHPRIESLHEVKGLGRSWLLLALLVAISAWQLQTFPVSRETALDLPGFLMLPQGVALALVLLWIAAIGGRLIVPLYTLLLQRSPRRQRARVLAVNNIINALFMVLSALWIMAVYAMGAGILTVLWMLSAMVFGVSIWSHRRRLRELNRSQND